MPAPKHAWTSVSHREEKPWGEAVKWHAAGHFDCKVITIRSGHRTSLKYHRTKDEVFYVMSGKILVRFGISKTLQNSEKYPWQERVLGTGEVFNVQSECPYRITALEESVLIEMGDRCIDNPIRLEDDYGRVNER
jgi:mannose-6-phosphate isomerase-like protein (cupin superfamily)